MVLAACGGGGGGSKAPSFLDPRVSPATAFWGTAGADFTVSGGRNLGGNGYMARLGGVPCTSATVNPANGAEVLAVCDIPNGGPAHTLDLTIWSGETNLTGALPIAMSWPPADGPVSFDLADYTSTATWWQTNAILRVTGGVNLPGHELVASLAGVPCDARASSEDPQVLELTCDTPPGGVESEALLLIGEGAEILTALAVDLEECAEAVAPADGVALPQLCNADTGSLAAGDLFGIGGLWRKGASSLLLAIPPTSEAVTGLFLARAPDSAWSGFFEVEVNLALGAAFTSSFVPDADIDESWSIDGYVPFTEPAALVPFGTVQGPAGSSFSFDEYSVANAMAVGTEDLVGTWGEPGDEFVLTVDGEGGYTGTTSGPELGACTIWGEITQAVSSAAPRANLFEIVMDHDGPACELALVPSMHTGYLHLGMAAIELVNVGTATAPVYARALVFIVPTPDRPHIAGQAIFSPR